MDEPPGPQGKRYRLRGLIVVTLVGLASWAVLIWLIVKFVL
ncbi:hypothetical protein [Microbispora oryzae]|nr:hypothetical protein [Microbispora oryzae]